MRPPVGGRPAGFCHIRPPSHDRAIPPQHTAIALVESTGLKSTSCPGMPVATRMNVVPSVLRYVPELATASTVAPSGDIATRLTAQNTVAVPDSCDHVVPPSMLLKIPAPLMESPLP